MKDRAKHTRLQLRKEAEQRKATRDTRTAKQQIAILDAKFGKEQGATRERARLADQIATAAGQKIIKPENIIVVPK